VAGGGLLILDLSDPTAPVQVGSYASGQIRSAHLSGNYVYVAEASYGFKVIDVSDPTAPSLIGRCDTPGTAMDVTASGSYAYVADSSNGLQVIDISDPTAPTLGARYATYFSTSFVALNGNYVYVTEINGIDVIDVSDPAVPTKVASYAFAGLADILFDGNTALLAGNPKFAVLDLTTPTAPVAVGDVSLASWGVAKSGNYAYVGGNTKFYGAVLIRYRREDFAEMQHGEGISPAWPYPYETLEPWYTAAERLYDSSANLLAP